MLVIVCQCYGVSDRTIRKAVRDGACSLRQVARASGAGRMCGGCRPVVEKLIDDEIGAVSMPAPMPGAVAAS
jgi:bacterioferritin-associated ferredoxin